MEKGNSLAIHIDNFSRIILDLEDINVRLENKNKAIVLHSYYNTLLTLCYMRGNL